MSSKVKPIPDGYHTVTPYLIVDDGAAAIEFYKQAFGAEELMRLESPDGKIGHAEVKIGDSPIMLADEHPEIGAISPKSLGDAAVSMMLYVEDADACFAQTVAAGASVKRPLTDQFYGDRSGTIEDPFGHKWTIGSHVEDVSPEEINRRMQSMMETEGE